MNFRVSGFIVDEKDTGLMAEKIIDLAKDENLRIQMGKEGKKITQS